MQVFFVLLLSSFNCHVERKKKGKLIVGHNMMTDVMQIMRQFFVSTLPEVWIFISK